MYEIRAFYISGMFLCLTITSLLKRYLMFHIHEIELRFDQTPSFSSRSLHSTTITITMGLLVMAIVMVTVMVMVMVMVIVLN